jgi:tetratricopeptide (TPR) repeat protein
MQYRLSYIDFNDKEIDQTDKVIRDLGSFLTAHPEDLSNGSMLCLMADTYKKKKEKAKTDEEGKKFEDQALECYDKVIWMNERPDDVIQYAIDNATTLLQGRKDWEAIAELHGKFLKTKPNSPLAMISATWVAKAYARAGRGPEAAELLATTLKSRIADPGCEQVETLIDELVKSMVPRKKVKDINIDALDKQLVEVLNKNIVQQNATTNARVYYARARLAQMVKRADLSDLYMRGIATLHIKNPSVLSPVLLAASGDLLLKENDLDGAEIMFKYLNEHYKESMFSDAGPVGLGYVALGRKKPEEALRIFEDVLENNAGTSRLKEATLGKLQALVDLDKLEPASKLAIEMVEDKMFRGQAAAKSYMQLGLIYRKQAAKADGDQSREFLAKAHGVYQRVYVAYQGFPEICAEGCWQAYLVLKELKEDVHAQETLKFLAKQLKLQNTARAEQAREMLK